MAAKVYGPGIFGVVGEAGMFVQSVDFDFDSETAMLPGEDGEDVSVAVLNPSGTFSLNGYRKGEDALPAKIGAAVALANAIDFTDFIDGVAGGQTIVTSGKLGKKNKDYATVDLGGIYKPFAGELQN